MIFRSLRVLSGSTAPDRARAEARRLAHEAEEDGFARGAESVGLAGREQRIEAPPRTFNIDEFAADQIKAGMLVGVKIRQRGIVIAAGDGAVERARRIAEVRLRSEIGAGGHDVRMPDHSAASRSGRG